MAPGTWQPLGDARQGYGDGNLKFELQGHMLHAILVMARLKGKGEKQADWLLMEESEAWARGIGRLQRRRPIARQREGIAPAGCPGVGAQGNACCTGRRRPGGVA